MARRRKKASRKTSSRRRRVSGVALSANSPIVQYGAIAAGYLMADTINGAIEKAVPDTVDPKIVAAAIAIGGYLIKSKVKGTAGAVAGGALMGSGIKKGLQAFNVISGVPVINGYRDLRTINGLPDAVRSAGVIASPSVISGVDSYSSYTDRD